VTRRAARIRRGAVALLVLGAGAGIGAFAIGRSGPPPKPDVVLVVVDTLRADHLGAYGYDQPTSPHLDRLARAGVRFTNARATSSWTLPSVASLLTGRYPAAHGAERNTDALASDVVTLPEALRDAGYMTAAFSANPAFVTPTQGLAQGFDTFVVLHGAATRRRAEGNTAPADPWLRSAVELAPADEVTARALRWIAGRDHVPAPYFVYAHYFDPHAGYFPPPAYATRFGVAEDDPLRGEAQWPLLLTFDAPAGPADTATLRKLYDAEIAFTDQQIGVLVEAVRARARRPTYFIVTSDHGEEFGDHGGIQHGRALWEELIRVPLIVLGPDVPPGGVVDTPVSLVSLWPTLAELLGAAPPAQADGPGLADLLRGGVPARAPRVFADLLPRFPRDRHLHRRAVIDGPWKLTVAPDRATALYDLASDPGERHDLGRAQIGRTKLLQAILKAHHAVANSARTELPPETVTLTEERRERLKALGYLH